jgi:hypothetical protein
MDRPQNVDDDGGHIVPSTVVACLVNERLDSLGGGWCAQGCGQGREIDFPEQPITAEQVAVTRPQSFDHAVHLHGCFASDSAQQYVG